MSVEVIVRCDVPGCDIVAPAYEPAEPGEFADIGSYGTHRPDLPPASWIDGWWEAPEGWTRGEHGIHCPAHRGSA